MLEDIPPVKTAAEVLRKEEENRRVIALRKKKIRRLTFSRVLTPNAAVDRPPAPQGINITHRYAVPSLLPQLQVQTPSF